MGTTLVNLRVRRRADRRAGDMRSIARAIEKLGYRPVRKGEAAQKRVVLRPTSDGRFVSVYDSERPPAGTCPPQPGASVPS